MTLTSVNELPESFDVLLWTIHHRCSVNFHSPHRVSNTWPGVLTSSERKCHLYARPHTMWATGIPCHMTGDMDQERAQSVISGGLIRRDRECKHKGIFLTQRNPGRQLVGKGDSRNRTPTPRWERGVEKSHSYIKMISCIRNCDGGLWVCSESLSFRILKIECNLTKLSYQNREAVLASVLSIILNMDDLFNFVDNFKNSETFRELQLVNNSIQDPEWHHSIDGSRHTVPSRKV